MVKGSCISEQPAAPDTARQQHDKVRLSRARLRRKKEGLALTDVNCGLGVDVVRVRLVLVGRPHALVIVLVAVHEKVNALVKEQLLQPAAAGAAFAHRSGGRVAVAVTRAVDAAVAMHHDPTVQQVRF